MENLLTIENITLFIALWGAFLSTHKVASDYSKNARKLRVSDLNRQLIQESRQRARLR